MNNPMKPTTSLDLPVAVAAILNMQRAAPAAPAQAPIPEYYNGGMIGPGGTPEPMGGMPAPEGVPASGGIPMAGGAGLSQPGQPAGPMDPQMMEMQVNQFANQNPQQVQEIRAAIMEAMQSGELTQDELNMIVQLATVAAQNPDMYPNVRKFAIQQGIATEQDLPQEYDQGLIMVLLLAAKAIQADMGGQDMMQGGALPSMAKGGPVPDSNKADGAVLINAHEGEYVIPANVVKMKGKEFFDSLVEKYKT